MDSCMFEANFGHLIAGAIAATESSHLLLSGSVFENNSGGQIASLFWYDVYDSSKTLFKFIFAVTMTISSDCTSSRTIRSSKAWALLCSVWDKFSCLKTML